MSYTGTQITAWTDAYFLMKDGYDFRTILNCGVQFKGHHVPEHWVWKKLFPNKTLVGIDPNPRPKDWEGIYYQCALGIGDTESVYCARCHSTACRLPERHGRQGNHSWISCLPLDGIRKGFPGPYFLWIDIDGAEMEALAGARETLEKTRFISIEMIEGTEHSKAIHTFLSGLGYQVWYKHVHASDRLYRHPTYGGTS